MCVNHFNISHFDPGYAIVGSEYVFVMLKREMSLFSSCRRCTYTISDWLGDFWVFSSCNVRSTSSTTCTAVFVLYMYSCHQGGGLVLHVHIHEIEIATCLAKGGSSGRLADAQGCKTSVVSTGVLCTRSARRRREIWASRRALATGPPVPTSSS